MAHEPAQVRETVLRVVAAVLDVAPDDLAHVEDLGRLDGFASFQMVETVERLEEAYGLEFAPADLEPGTLRSTRGLVELVLRTRAGAEVARS